MMKVKFSLVIRVLALILILLFFVPTTVVSCSGYETLEEAKISPFKIATGDIKQTTYDMSKDGQEPVTKQIEDVEAQPIYFILVGLSLVILVLGTRFPVISSIFSASDSIMLIWMHNQIVDYVLEHYENVGVRVKMTTGFFLYIIISAGIIAMLLFLKFRSRIQMRKDISENGIGDGDSRICPVCHNNIPAESTFCGYCGAHIENSASAGSDYSKKIGL